MNEQITILFFLIFGTGITLFLYLWKAKKEVDYMKDERWQFIQNKANNAANYLNYILIVFLAVGEALLIISNAQITLTLNRVLIYGILFIGLRNAIELFALRYFDKRM
ncbi:hypothetical protein NBE98_03725 [Clostridium swellfunianum]|uniref:hypothetical protein n=1 Tax=Clostridium swellfunianum TaxID=1367462 RepID=UPI00202FC343|nr:hypothetical protein [Clostridium swellfunianum]MCM0647487.1 hypothetical protein [Clostridium swellfunianum]